MCFDVEKIEIYLILSGWLKDKHSGYLNKPLWHNKSLGLFWIDTETAYEVTEDKKHGLRK
jgi:hypothetical protein